MPRLFSYGSLQRADVRQATLGRAIDGAPARLPGFTLVHVPIAVATRAVVHGTTHYANVVANGRRETGVPGTVFEVTGGDLTALDGYEAADGYARVELSIASGAPAWVYVHAPTADTAMAQEARARQATFFRTALWLGLVRGAEVLAWTEAQLIAAPDAPAALVDLAVVHADDVSGLRHALLALGPESPPPTVVDAIFGLVGRQLADGRRSLDDTCTVLAQARQWLPLPAALADVVKQFEVARLRETAGGPPANLDGLVREWLAQFAGREAPFTSR